jgi:hypothetical protein
VVTSQQVFYETTAELGAGEELLLGPREPVQLDMFGESTTASEDRSDRETGEFDCSLCGLLTGRSALELINGTSRRLTCRHRSSNSAEAVPSTSFTIRC